MITITQTQKPTNVAGFATGSPQAKKSQATILGLQFIASTQN